MIKTVMKTIGTLTAGCVVGVVVALSWTGQGDLDATLSYVNELEIMIKDHAGNADALLERLEEQQAVYRNDVKVYYDAVKEGNAQTSKANAEIEKANKAAAELKVTVEDKVNKIKEEVGGTNKVPDLVQNPDVNHPDGEHDNGVGGAIQTPCGDVCPNPQCSNPTNCSKEKHNTTECCGAGHHKVPGTTNVHVSSGYIKSECMWDYGNN